MFSVKLLAFAKFVNWKISLLFTSALFFPCFHPCHVHNFKHVWSYQGVSWFQGSAKRPAWLARRAGRVPAGTWRNAGVSSAVSAGFRQITYPTVKASNSFRFSLKIPNSGVSSGFSIQLPGSASGLPSIHPKTEYAVTGGIRLESPPRKRAVVVPDLVLLKLAF